MTLDRRRRGRRPSRLGPRPAPPVDPAAPTRSQRIFGDALAVLPPPARRFLLYFDLGADTLTPESQALVPEILALGAGAASPT